MCVTHPSKRAKGYDAILKAPKNVFYTPKGRDFCNDDDLNESATSSLHVPILARGVLREVFGWLVVWVKGI